MQILSQWMGLGPSGGLRIQPPSPLLNLFVRVAVYFEPNIFFKIHAQPLIDAALIFSLVLFVYVFFLML